MKKLEGHDAEDRLRDLNEPHHKPFETTKLQQRDKLSHNAIVLGYLYRMAVRTKASKETSDLKIVC